MSNKYKKSLSQTVVKAIDIFQCFQDDRDEKGIQEISKILDLPESTIYRLINTLEYEGILIQNKKTKKYRLGFKLLKLIEKLQNMDQWKNKAKKHMIDINKRFNETINLAIREKNKAVYIESVGSTHVLRPSMEIGAKYPIHCTGLGKCLLMDFSKEELVQVLELPLKKHTENTIVDLEELYENIKQGNQNGYIMDKEEFQKGIICTAAPIRGFGEKIVAALSITIPTVRYEEKETKKIKKNVIKTANKISEELDFL